MHTQQGALIRSLIFLMVCITCFNYLDSKDDCCGMLVVIMSEKCCGWLVHCLQVSKGTLVKGGRDFRIGNMAIFGGVKYLTSSRIQHADCFNVQNVLYTVLYCTVLFVVFQLTKSKHYFREKKYETECSKKKHKTVFHDFFNTIKHQQWQLSK